MLTHLIEKGQKRNLWKFAKWWVLFLCSFYLILIFYRLKCAVKTPKWPLAKTFWNRHPAIVLKNWNGCSQFWYICLVKSSSLQNLERFIFTCHKIACELTSVQTCSDRGESGIHCAIIGHQNNILKKTYSSIPSLEFLKKDYEISSKSIFWFMLKNDLAKKGVKFVVHLRKILNGGKTLALWKINKINIK